MPESGSDTTDLVRRLNAGDEQARKELIARACERLRRKTSQMLKGYAVVKRWEQTGDVLQNALIRLHRALADVTLESSSHFWNLAALQIRRELIDLAQHHLGPESFAANHRTDGPPKVGDGQDEALESQPDENAEPSSLEEWVLFHEKVSKLPDIEREVFNHLYYVGLSQQETAHELGVSLRTVKRRWQSARYLLSKALSDKPVR
jgi:RNA polymerase sigma factor (sigma-70 family)